MGVIPVLLCYVIGSAPSVPPLLSVLSHRHLMAECIIV